MSKEKHKKTNALRILDTHKVPYSISEYEWSEERAAGLHVVEVLGLDEKQVFKTLVGKGDKTGYVVFCIPVAAELDMKQAARVSHNKSVELVHVNPHRQSGRHAAPRGRHLRRGGLRGRRLTLHRFYLTFPHLSICHNFRP